MTGIWLLILFIILPGAAGGAIAFIVSKGEVPRPKVLAVGAAIGAVIGVTAGLLLFRY